MHKLISNLISAEIGTAFLFISFRISQWLKAKTQAEKEKALLAELKRDSLIYEAKAIKKIEKTITGLREDLAVYMGEKLKPPGEE